MADELSLKQKLSRLAFSYRETAALLGISYTSVYRLVKRGELKTSHSLRRIPAAEIERFLSRFPAAAKSRPGPGPNPSR